jgi:hypothetical protein
MRLIKRQFILVTILLISFLHAKSQDFQIPQRYTGKKHRGFFLSCSPGINFTQIAVESEKYGYSSYEGFGSGFGLKIGGALVENLILHATMLVHSVEGPKIKSDVVWFNNIKLDNSVSLTEGMMGIGLTYYNSYNYLISGTIGMGGITLVKEKENYNFSTDNGFSLQLKAGREWWIAPNFGIGAAAYYQYSNIHSQAGTIVEEFITTNNIGVVLSATLNGRK